MLKDYRILCQVKPKSLQTKYPYTSINDEHITKTMKRINLIYKHLTPEHVKKEKKKIGGGKYDQITVVLC